MQHISNRKRRCSMAIASRQYITCLRLCHVFSAWHAVTGLLGNIRAATDKLQAVAQRLALKQVLVVWADCAWWMKRMNASWPAAICHQDNFILSKALAGWRQVNQRRRDVAQALISFIHQQERHLLCSAFQGWLRQCLRARSAKAMAVSCLMKWQQHLLCTAWSAWQAFAVYQVQNEALLQRAVSLWCNTLCARALRTWTLAIQQKHDVALQHKQVHARWQRKVAVNVLCVWRKHARNCRLASRVTAHWLHTMLTQSFNTWRSNTALLQYRAFLLGRACQHWNNRYGMPAVTLNLASLNGRLSPKVSG
jgi:hypothetical protein